MLLSFKKHSEHTKSPTSYFVQNKHEESIFFLLCLTLGRNSKLSGLPNVKKYYLGYN